MAKKIIQIAATATAVGRSNSTSNDHTAKLFALDSDGHVWVTDPSRREPVWRLLPDLPGDEAEG